MRHVLLLDAGPISQRKGRAYWSKSVAFQDVPVFGAITGPKFTRALRHWTEHHPIRTATIANQARQTGIHYQPASVLRVTRTPTNLLQIQSTTQPLPHKRSDVPGVSRGEAPGRAEGSKHVQAPLVVQGSAASPGGSGQSPVKTFLTKT